MKYFDPGIPNNQLKIQYRKLAMKYHPDHGGSTIMFQEMVAEYNQCMEQKKPKKKESYRTETTYSYSWTHNFRMTHSKVEDRIYAIKYMLRQDEYLGISDSKVKFYTAVGKNSWYSDKVTVTIKLESEDKKLLELIVKYLILQGAVRTA